MRSSAALLLLLTVSSAFGGNAVFRMENGVVKPVHEQRIELKRQSLHLKRDGDFMNVQARLEFDNRSGEVQKRLVGFVAPPTSNISNSTGIENFSVRVNDRATDHSIKRLKSNPATHTFGFFGGEFLFLFELTLGHGPSTVVQQYRVPFVAADGLKTFSYPLRGDTLWNPRSQFGFHLDIDMGAGAYFAVPVLLPEASDRWHTQGIARIDNETIYHDGTYFRRAYTKDGTVHFGTTRFTPNSNLRIELAESIYDLIAHFQGDSETDNTLRVLLAESIDSRNSQSCRSLLNALHGYYFAQPELRDYYSNAFWYFPGDSTQNKDIIFSEHAKKYFDIIRLVESVDRREFWSEFILPLFEKNVAKIRTIAQFPLDGAWSTLLRPPFGVEEGSADHFSAVYETIYEELLFDKLGAFERCDISVNYLSELAGIYIDVTIRRGYKTRAVLKFQHIWGEWKLVSLLWFG